MIKSIAKLFVYGSPYKPWGWIFIMTSFTPQQYSLEFSKAFFPPVFYSSKSTEVSNLKNGIQPGIPVTNVSSIVNYMYIYFDINMHKDSIVWKKERWRGGLIQRLSRCLPMTMLWIILKIALSVAPLKGFEKTYTTRHKKSLMLLSSKFCWGRTFFRSFWIVFIHCVSVKWHYY